MMYQQFQKSHDHSTSCFIICSLARFTSSSKYIIKPLAYQQSYKSHDYITPCFIICSLAMPRGASEMPQRSPSSPRRIPQASPSASQELPQTPKPNQKQKPETNTWHWNWNILKQKQQFPDTENHRVFPAGLMHVYNPQVSRYREGGKADTLTCVQEKKSTIKGTGWQGTTSPKGK